MFKKICLLVLGAMLVISWAFGGEAPKPDYRGIDFDAFQVQIWEGGKPAIQEFQIQGFEGLHVDYHNESVYVALKSKPQKKSKMRSKSYVVRQDDIVGLMIQDRAAGKVFKLQDFTVNKEGKGIQYRFSSSGALAYLETDLEGQFQRIVFAYEKKPGGIAHYLKLSEMTDRRDS